MSKTMKVDTKEYLSVILSTAILSAGVGLILGMLLAVDTGEYGPVSELKHKHGAVCRVYEVEEYRVSLCNNGVIAAEEIVE